MSYMQVGRLRLSSGNVVMIALDPFTDVLKLLAPKSSKENGDILWMEEYTDLCYALPKDEGGDESE